MPWQHRPIIDFQDQPEFRWPYWKVGLNEDDLFGSLYDRFDEPTPLLDPVTFHHEVQHVASNTDDKDEFLRQVDERIKGHAQNIDEMLYSLFITIIEGRSSLNQTQQHKFVHFHQYRSLNSLAVFLSSVVDPSHHKDQPFSTFGSLHQQACNPRLKTAQQGLPRSRSSSLSPSSVLSSSPLESPAAPNVAASSSTHCSDISPGPASNKKQALDEQDVEDGDDARRAEPCIAVDDTTRCPSTCLCDEPLRPANHENGPLHDQEDHHPSLEESPAASMAPPHTSSYGSNGSAGRINSKKRSLDGDDESPRALKRTRHFSSEDLPPKRRKESIRAIESSQPSCTSQHPNTTSKAPG